jgi:hypothetical protein
MSGTTADIFDEQKKASEAENYRQISRRYEKQYKDKFDKDFVFNF